MTTCQSIVFILGYVIVLGATIVIVLHFTNLDRRK